MKRLSLSHKLTLVIASVLSLVLLATFAATYRTVSATETTAAQETLGRLATELAGSVDAVTRRQATALRSMGSDSILRQLLLRDSSEANNLEVILRRRLSIDSSTSVRIWRRDGRLYGQSLNGPGLGKVPQEAIPPRDDVAHFGPIYIDRDTAVYWAVSPMLDAAAGRIGWIGERRFIASSPEEQRGIRALLGDGIALYFRNDTGTLWVDIAGKRVAGPSGASFRQGVDRYERSTAHGQVLAAQADIRNTAWTLVLERPLSSAIAPARASVLLLGILGIALLLVAVAAVWLISHHFADPVVRVARAAEIMKTGDFDTRVDDRLTRGGDEVAQLAQSFNGMAAEVQAVHAELEQQVEEAQSLNEELEQALQEAGEANRAKTRFVTRMSHELRTPLNAIAGYSDLLELGIYGSLNEEQRDALERIRLGQRALLSLIDDVLRLAQLESARIHFDIAPVVLRDVVEQAHALVAPQLRSRAIAFESRHCDTNVVALGDAEKVRRILTHLLTNAWKFTHSGGNIEVQCRTFEDRAAIDVRDTGIGIAADRTEIIFEPFVQLHDDLTRTAEGMGLGLAISRELARGMGGELVVASREGHGSVFTLTLPSGVPAPRAAVAPVAAN